MKQVIMNVLATEKRIAVKEDGIVQDLYIERPEMVEQVGNIYKGRIVKVLPGMDCAFIDIGLDQNGYLPKAELINGKEKETSISQLIHEGQEIIVQISKTSTETKGPKVTQLVEIPGKYIVYLPYSNYIAVSKRLTEKEKMSWRELGEQLCDNSEGLIIRTACLEAGEELVQNELTYLRDSWISMINNKQEKPPAVLANFNEIPESFIRQHSLMGIDEIIVDDSKVVRYLKSHPLLASIQEKIQTYSGRENIFSHYGIDRDLEKALRQRVWLKSGGFIIIEQTETMTVIDVNTGKYTGKTDKETTVVKVNKEAAIEVAKQIRLRELGGIIIIDFIDMKSNYDQGEVLKTLIGAVKNDPMSTRIIGFTQLGLVEMTRKKGRKNLKEKWFAECNYCHGSGVVESKETIAYQVEHQLLELKGSDAEAVWIDVGEKVASVLLNQLNQLEEKSGLSIKLTSTIENGFTIRHIGKLADITKRINQLKL